MASTRLNMDIVVDGNTFRAIDKTIYADYNHFTMQKLEHITSCDEKLLVGEILFRETKTESDLKESLEISGIEDGHYLYKKLVLPTKGHVNASNDYLYYDPADELVYYVDSNQTKKSYNPKSDFEDIWDKALEPSVQGCQYFDDQCFSLYDTITCYISVEAEILSGCKKTLCSTGQNVRLYTDLLLGALNVIEWYIDKEEWGNAQAMLDKLKTCSSLFGVSKNTCSCG